MSTPLSIPDAIERAATCWPDRIAVQIPEGESFKTLTYAEVIDRFRKQAKQLIKTGIKPGDRIVLLAENGPEWAVACLSALAAGATVVPLDGALSPPDLEDLIRRADPRALMLTQAQHEALAPSSRFGLPVYNIENQLSPFEENGHQPADTSSTTDPDLEAALLIFTSGTTGDSKGILLGHQGLLHTARACFQAIELDAQEPLRVLCVLPLHHVTGFTVTFLGPLLEGGTVTFVEALNAQAILEAMQKSQTTILPAIPRLFELFHTEIHRKVQAKGAVARKTFGSLVAFCATVRRFTPWNPGPVIFRTVHEAFGGSLRLCCSGAAPLPLEVLHGLENLGFNVIEAYGLTEASGVSTINSVSNRRPGTVGLPISDTEIQIANATPSTSEGEICIRGPVQMHRYFRDESTTSQVIRDGWLRTGDLGKIDHRGYLTVTGRLKELIVTSGGKNVSPADVERRYSDLPGVAELAVFGMPAKEGFGEEVHAAFVPDATTPAESSQQAVETAVQERAADIPAHMRIQGIHILSELPKTTTFKVKRGELKQLEASKASGTETRKADPNSPLDEVSQQVLTVVHEAMRQSEDPSQVTLDATLQFELGFDSLGLIELAARIENHFNVRLEEHRLPTLYTVADLVQAVNSAPALAECHASLGDRTEPILPPRGLTSRIALRAFGLLSHSLWKFEVSGLEHIPAKAPFILCPNHESHFDFFLVASVLRPDFRRNLCCFAKREHFESFGTRLVAQLASAIPTDRDGDILPALRSGAKVLTEGRLLLIHPEGTRTRTGKLGPFRGGAARLAIEAKAPLVPVRIVGAFTIFPPHRPLPRLFNWRSGRRHRLKLIFGPPITPDNAKQEKPTESGLTEDLRLAVQTLEN